MCVITVDVALCDSTYPNTDVPDGCLKFYPYTYSEYVCEQADSVLGFCGIVEMQKREDGEGSRIEKRTCAACVAWAALMRGRDGRRARHSLRRDSTQSSGSEYSAAVMTPSDSEEFSHLEADVRSTASGDLAET